MNTVAFKTGQNHGGVQCHSVGDIYPNRIVIKGAGQDHFDVHGVDVDGADIVQSVRCNRTTLRSAIKYVREGVQKCLQSC